MVASCFLELDGALPLDLILSLSLESYSVGPLERHSYVQLSQYSKKPHKSIDANYRPATYTGLRFFKMMQK
jgi:hypothetical protein